jgi:hypothetical protein
VISYASASSSFQNAMTLPTDIQVEAPDRNRLLLIPKLVLLGAAVFAAGEASWRFTGFQPAPSDLLAFGRFYRAARDSSNAVALIGSSKVLCDLDPRTLKRELPKWDFYQLAINGSSALPMLENLAQDTMFHGYVLCEFNTAHFMAEYPFRKDETDALSYVQFIQRRSYLDFLTAWFFETLSQRSALGAAKDWDFIGVFAGRLASIVRNRAESNSALLTNVVRRDDRSWRVNRRGKDNSRLIARWAEMGRSKGKRANNLQRVASWVEAIRRRGGDVVFIRMPVSGSLKRIEDETYPDRDWFIQSLAGSGINIIDSAKEPALSGFDCPDESHLDADDVGRFSTALARILEDRQLLTRTPRTLR